MSSIASAIDLYWLPLGSGGRVVRPGGVIVEAMAARLSSRPRRDLYHTALEVHLANERFVIELMPYIWGAVARANKGVVAHGPVGARLAARLAVFRYELRCWRDGVLTDAESAVESPVSLTADAAAARRILDLIPEVPMATWGRDEFGVGEVWTSNSVVSWLIARAGAWSPDLRPPACGRAPGWQAGLRVSARNEIVRPGSDAFRPMRECAAESPQPMTVRENEL